MKQFILVLFINFHTNNYKPTLPTPVDYLLRILDFKGQEEQAHKEKNMEIEKVENSVGQVGSAQKLGE